MSTSRDLTTLVEEIQRNKIVLDQRAASLGVPLPSFDYDAPALYGDAEAVAARKAIEDASSELHELTKGPVGMLIIPAHNYHTTIHAVARLGIAEAIPVENDASLSFDEIAAACNLEPSVAKRLVKMAVTHHIFREQPIGKIRHNATSRLLASDPKLRQLILMIMEELWPAGTKVVEAVQTFSPAEAQDPKNSAYGLAHNFQDGFFELMAKHPQRFERFAHAMDWFAKGPGLEAHHLADGFAWEPVQKVVDVGGSHGAVSMAVAQRYPHIKFVIQDRPEVADNGRKQLPSSFDNITFQAHDFFQQQPVKDADVYLLRQILHDWSDSYATAILKSLVPALDAGGGSIVIMEQILPEPGVVSIPTEQAIRSFDLAMLAISNGRERDMADWAALLANADPRLCIVKVSQPPASRMAIIEARLQK